MISDFWFPISDLAILEITKILDIQKIINQKSEIIRLFMLSNFPEMKSGKSEIRNQKSNNYFLFLTFRFLIYDFRKSQKSRKSQTLQNIPEILKIQKLRNQKSERDFWFAISDFWFGNPGNPENPANPENNKSEIIKITYNFYFLIYDFKFLISDFWNFQKSSKSQKPWKSRKSKIIRQKRVYDF